MTLSFFTRAGGAVAASLMLLSAQAWADGAGHDHSHDHSHEHAHDHASADIGRGIFEDAQVQDRALSDWEGDWQSVYPHLQDGTLDGVMRHKAEHGPKSPEAYRAEYEAGYRTDVDRIVIKGNRVTFQEGERARQGRYEYDGREVLTYKAGNRGVRYVFRKVEGDDAAPDFIQFSDHAIAPVQAGHYHLYWGDDRAALLQEVTHWPTYYPSSTSGEDIAREMMAH